VLEAADLAKLLDANTRFVKLDSGWVRRDLAELHGEAARVLSDLGLEAGQGTQRLTLWQIAQARPESLVALERMGADPGATRALESLRERIASFEGLPTVAQPGGIEAELRPYQRQGLDFLAYTSSIGLGAILADDMGLGKTVQALAWVEHLRDLDPAGGPVLVVCPTSVVHNWEREARRFAPGMRVLLLTSGATRCASRSRATTWSSRATRCCGATSRRGGRSICAPPSSTRRSSSRTRMPRSRGRRSSSGRATAWR